MKIDYEKLVKDLSTANQLANDSIKNMDDGGTANLDCVFLRIPRAREDKVLEAIKKAGLYCSSRTKWIGSGYMIIPTGVGQGNTRYKGVEVMAKVLKDFGWDVSIYYRVD